jgi:ribosome-binding ATPase YchF (GTP1/OBG family)
VELLNRLKAVLEEEKPISTLSLSPDEDLLIRNYGFLTAKPCVVVVNVDEDALLDRRFSRSQPVLEYCGERDIPVQFVSARIEREISELEEEERQTFMEEIGITESGLMAVTRIVYQKLGLISFFTVGEDEVKAWTVEQGSAARKAAGKIHSDIERGFIRAEVIDFESFQKAGSMAAARNEGTLRLEGKEYIVKDGDIVHFRFNV